METAHSDWDGDLVSQSDTPMEQNVDKKLCEDRHVKSQIKCELDDKNEDTCKRQATLSKYLPEEPPETPVKLTPDNTPEKMVNVSLLLSQLLNARVVINRLPDNKIVKTEPPTSYRASAGVQRYCHVCKTLNVDRIGLVTPKDCSKCGTLLLYVCDKCNEKHYHTYKGLNRHTNRCTGKVTGKSLNDILMLFCAECPFKTSYQFKMTNHAKCMNHKVLDSAKRKNLFKRRTTH